MSKIHPLVLATIENERARRELELERLRSARESCVAVSPDGQSRALALGKKIRELEQVTASWRLVLATVLSEVHRTEEAAKDAQAAFDGMVRAAKRETEALRVVGSVTRVNKRLRCLRCTEIVAENLPRATLRDVTSEDLPDGGMCADCNADVLA